MGGDGRVEGQERGRAQRALGAVTLSPAEAPGGHMAMGPVSCRSPTSDMSVSFQVGWATQGSDLTAASLSVLPLRLLCLLGSWAWGQGEEGTWRNSIM